MLISSNKVIDCCKKFKQQIICTVLNINKKEIYQDKYIAFKAGVATNPHFLTIPNLKTAMVIPLKSKTEPIRHSVAGTAC